MAIQQSINSMWSTLGTAASIKKHLDEEEKAKKITAISALSNISNEQASLTEQEGINKEALGNVESSLNENMKDVEGSFSSLSDQRLRTSKGYFMSNKAFQSAEEQINLNRIQKQGLEARLEDISNRQNLNSQKLEILKKEGGIK